MDLGFEKSEGPDFGYSKTAESDYFWLSNKGLLSNLSRNR